MTDPLVRHYGDSGILVDLGSVHAAHRVAEAIQAAVDADDLGGRVIGVAVGFGNVVVLLDHPDGPEGSLLSWVERVVLRSLEPDRASLGGSPAGGAGPGPGSMEIPVVFDGPDLPLVAAAIGADELDVAELLTRADLEVAFIGFAPGFPYLTGLPPELARIPRRATPRPSVPAGSVAIAAGFASVYPRATPGGWMLVGSTTARLFDPDCPPYARVRAGDRVRFRRTTDGGQRAHGDPEGQRPPLQARGGRWAEVVDPGLVTLVQDQGRRGVAGIGVPGAGASDPDGLLLANRLVGNPDCAAVLELSARGPALRFAVGVHVAVVGCQSGAVDVELDGRPCPDSTVVPVGPGQVLAVGRVHTGLRACLAVSGGFETRVVMGSRSSDVLTGLGLGPLRVGDRLELGASVRPRGSLLGTGATFARPRAVRVLAGPRHVAGPAWAQLLEDRWTVDVASNRIGVRLVGTGGPLPAGPGEAASTGMITGAVQVPPDGQPIILLPDHATVGGYPVIACVITADRSLVAQLAPGDALTFIGVDRAGAHRAWTERDRVLDGRVAGWFPTATGI